MSLPAILSAQDQGARPTRMPRCRSNPVEELQTRYHSHFWVRCQRVADTLNRPQFRFLRAVGVVPPPPHCGLLVGQRRWRNLFIRWRELGYAMARELGFPDE